MRRAGVVLAFVMTMAAASMVAQHGYSPAEVAEVIGTAVEYRVSEVANRNAGVIAKLPKAQLATLAKQGERPAAKRGP